VTPSPIPRVLLACTPQGLPIFRGILTDVELVPALTEDEALKHLEDDFDLILCSMQFDESRMLDFLVAAKKRSPDIPFLCCRVLESELPQRSFTAAITAAKNAGAQGLVDVPILEREFGIENAHHLFRRIIGASLIR